MLSPNFFRTFFIFLNFLDLYSRRAELPLLERVMPKKRRKLVVTSVTPEIPFPKVRVEWIDCVSDSGWATEKEFDKMRLSFPVNEGWLYNKDRHAIKLFASYDKEDDGTFTFGDRTMIPLSVVKKIQKI